MSGPRRQAQWWRSAPAWRCGARHWHISCIMFLSASSGSCCSHRSRRPETGWARSSTIPMACWRSRPSAAFSSSSALPLSFRGSMVFRASSSGFPARAPNSAVARLEPSLAEAGGPVALEAAWRAILETARLPSMPCADGSPAQPFVTTRRSMRSARPSSFCNRYRWKPFDLGAIEPRLVRLCHALDHLTRLIDDLQQPPEVEAVWRLRPASKAARGHSAPGSTPRKTPRHRPILRSSRRSNMPRNSLTRNAKRAARRLLEDVAAAANAGGDRRAPFSMSSHWADGALHHAWRLAESLRIASGQRPLP